MVERGMMVEHATDRVIEVTQHAALGRVLDQLRDGSSGEVTLRLDPLSVLFATPDHFRALDAMRIARRLSLTIEVADAHRTGLALAFGYRVRPLRHDLRGTTAPVPDVHYGPPNRTGALHGERQPQTVAAVQAAKPSTPHRGLARRSRRGAFVALACVCVAVASTAGALLTVSRVHTADVWVIPSEQSFSRTVPFAVSVMPTDDPNTLQTTRFEAIIVREGDTAATGTKTVPDATASGSMIFRSRADSATTLKAGTPLKGPRDVSYILQSDTVVPGLDFGRGQLGEVTGKVQAAQPGSAGNLGVGFTARYTDNVTYISGEITGGTEKQIGVVTADDVAGLRARLESDGRLHALTEMSAALPTRVTALNDYLTLRPPTMTAQPPVGAQADTVHVRVAITAQVPVYQNADFDALIDQRLNDVVREVGTADGTLRQVIPGSVAKSKPVFVDVQGSVVRYFATVTGNTRAVLTDADLARMRSALVGRDARGAEQLLSNEPTLHGFTVRYGPSWLPKVLRNRMPRTESHLHVHIGTQP